MPYVVAAILAVVSVLFIAYPMLSRRRYLDNLEYMFDLGDVRQRRYLEHKKMNILENIKELDFDYEMGKLSDEDHKRLRQGYLVQAQETVEALDKLTVREEIEQLIESEVRTRRRID